MNGGVVKGAPNPVAVHCAAGIIVTAESKVAAQYRGVQPSADYQLVGSWRLFFPPAEWTGLIWLSWGSPGHCSTPKPCVQLREGSTVQWDCFPRSSETLQTCKPKCTVEECMLPWLGGSSQGLAPHVPFPLTPSSSFYKSRLFTHVLHESSKVLFPSPGDIQGIRKSCQAQQLS